jgi:hypothetical protein
MVKAGAPKGARSQRSGEREVASVAINNSKEDTQ